MAEDFETLVPDARRFLTELAKNNDRDWFNGQKARYQAELKNPAMAFLDVIAADLQKFTGSPVDTKLFRPHRDVRFSKDKTPYHTHLHMLWTSGPGGWFLGISPDYISAGAGVFAFDKPGLTAWREAVAGPDGASFANLIATLVESGARIGEPELKRVPAPFDKDHPHEELLRRKGLTLWFDTNEADVKKNGLTGWVRTAFSELLPVQKALAALL